MAGLFIRNAERRDLPEITEIYNYYVLNGRAGFQVVGVFSENGRKFGKYWDVCWTERGG